MNPRRSLMGLFTILFFLSALSLGVLVIDDRQDLSSRASNSWLQSNLQPAIPEEKLAPNETIWDGAPYNIPVSIRYNQTLWIPPRESIPVFYNQLSPITLRLFNGKLDTAGIQKLLGPNFSFLKLSGDPLNLVSGWITQAYSVKFLGQDRTLELWTGPENISLVSVSPDLSTRLDIADFAQSITFTRNGSVKGDATSDESARIAALVRPSVVMILNNYCAQAEYSGKSYPFCLASAGTGFFVNKDGFLATNGHVVVTNPEDSIFYTVASGGLSDLLSDYLIGFYQLGGIPASSASSQIKQIQASKESLYQIAGVIRDLYRKNILKIDNSKNQYFVQLSNTPLQLSKSGVNVGKDIVQATLVDSDYLPPDPTKGFTTSDIAILKVPGTNYPGLPLGNISDVSVGSSVQIIGYPGVVMGTNSLLLDTSANAEPTFTKGVVSSFKKAKGNLKNLIQTDASINHGNSGGPAISSDGKVIGIATYGLTPEEGAGNYNFLRDVADLKTLMAKNHITEDTGVAFSSWKSGLNNYWLSYFKYAKSDFEKVINVYPIHPTAGTYLTNATKKIGTPEDQTPRFTRQQRGLLMDISGGMMTISVVMILILGVSNFVDSRRQRMPYKLPPQPVQTF